MTYLVGIAVLAMVGITVSLFQFKAVIHSSIKLTSKIDATKATKSTKQDKIQSKQDKLRTKQDKTQTKRDKLPSKKIYTPASMQAISGRLAYLQGIIVIGIFNLSVNYLQGYPNSSAAFPIHCITMIAAIEVSCLVLYMACSAGRMGVESLDLSAHSTSAIVYILYARNLLYKVCLVLSGLLCFLATFILLSLVMIL